MKHLFYSTIGFNIVNMLIIYYNKFIEFDNSRHFLQKNYIFKREKETHGEYEKY